MNLTVFYPFPTDIKSIIYTKERKESFSKLLEKGPPPPLVLHLREKLLMNFKTVNGEPVSSQT